VSMRRRFTALVAISLVLLVAWYFTIFRTSRSDLSDVRDQVATTQAEVAQLTAKLAELQELRRDEARLRADAARFSDALPTDPALSDFILDVQAAANQSRIAFLSVAPSLPAVVQGAEAAPAPAAPASPAPSPSPDTEAPTTPQTPATPAGLQSITVSITASGGFFAIEDFVAKMERLERALRVDTFTLGGGGEAGLSLSMSLRMFMTPAAAAAATTQGT
jgi:Tfp pilus assembly protein PilO